MVPLTRMGSPGFPRRPGCIPTPAGDIFEFPLTTMRCFGENVPFTGGLALRLTLVPDLPLVRCAVPFTEPVKVQCGPQTVRFESFQPEQKNFKLVR